MTLTRNPERIRASCDGVAARNHIHREPVRFKPDGIPVQGAVQYLRLIAEVDHVDIVFFHRLRCVLQPDGDVHRGLGLHRLAILLYGDVQRLDIVQVVRVRIQRLSGPDGVFVDRRAGQLGHRQLRAGGDARLGAVADLHAIGVAGGVYVMGGDGLGDHHGVQREAISFKGDFGLVVPDSSRFRITRGHLDTQACPAVPVLSVGLLDDLGLAYVVHVDDHGILVLFDLADRDDHGNGDARLDLIAGGVIKGDVHQLHTANLHEVVCYALADVGQGVGIPHAPYRHGGAFRERALVRRHGDVDARGPGREGSGGPGDGGSFVHFGLRLVHGRFLSRQIIDGDRRFIRRHVLGLDHRRFLRSVSWRAHRVLCHGVRRGFGFRFRFLDLLVFRLCFRFPSLPGFTLSFRFFRLLDLRLGHRCFRLLDLRLGHRCFRLLDFRLRHRFLSLFDFRLGHRHFRLLDLRLRHRFLCLFDFRLGHRHFRLLDLRLRHRRLRLLHFWLRHRHFRLLDFRFRHSFLSLFNFGFSHRLLGLIDLGFNDRRFRLLDLRFGHRLLGLIDLGFNDRLFRLLDLRFSHRLLRLFNFRFGHRLLGLLDFGFSHRLLGLFNFRFGHRLLGLLDFGFSHRLLGLLDFRLRHRLLGLLDFRLRHRFLSLFNFGFGHRLLGLFGFRFGSRFFCLFDFGFGDRFFCLFDFRFGHRLLHLFNFGFRVDQHALIQLGHIQ